MKSRLSKTLAAACMAGMLLASAALPAFASEPDYSAEIAAMDRWLDSLTVTQSGGAAVPATPSGEAATAPHMLTGDELQALTDTMFSLVNEQREQAGLAPLERDGLLDEAAMLRAAEIRVVDFAGGQPHTRPDGTSYKTALEALGITGRGYGENIARTKTSPEDAMQAWMDSESHRRNILKEKYDSIGIGAYQREDGKLDWIQLFLIN